MKKQGYQFIDVSEKTRKSMQKIRSKDTSIEVILRKRLWHDGYRYRKNYKKLPGSPDIAITKLKIAVFCDSEFFHGKDWEKLKARLERGKNPQYWINHIEKNMERDQRVDQALAFLDWTVIRFWGKDIKKDLENCVQVIEEAAFEKMMAMSGMAFFTMSATLHSCLMLRLSAWKYTISNWLVAISSKMSLYSSFLPNVFKCTSSGESKSTL